MNEGSQDGNENQRAGPSQPGSTSKPKPGPSSLAIEGRNSSRNSMDLEHQIHSQQEEAKEEDSG